MLEGNFAVYQGERREGDRGALFRYLQSYEKVLFVLCGIRKENWDGSEFNRMGTRGRITVRKHFLIEKEGECFYYVLDTLLSTQHKLSHLPITICSMIKWQGGSGAQVIKGS